MADITDHHFNDALNRTISTVLALRPQGPGCDGLAAFAPSGPCGVQSDINAIRILRLPEVMARVGLCRASIYLHMGKGMFPQSIPLGPRAVGWLEHEIDAWLTARIQTRQMNRM